MPCCCNGACTALHERSSGFYPQKSRGSRVHALRCLSAFGSSPCVCPAPPSTRSHCTLCLGHVSFVLFSLQTVATLLVSPLERQYPPLHLAASDPLRERIKWVVVLGSGHWTGPDLPAAANLDESALFRLVEGIRLARQLPRLYWYSVAAGTAMSSPMPRSWPQQQQT